MSEQKVCSWTLMGDSAMRVELPEGVDSRAVLRELRSLPGVQDVVVTEQHAAVYFDPAAARPDPTGVIEQITGSASINVTRPLIIIRARYDGPDLPRVAEYAGLSTAEVIELHTARDYSVRVVGFMPGFAYLGEVDARIAAPRLPTPRTRVPANAIGLAGQRTGIYPLASPGGWNLIATAQDFIPFQAEHGATLQLGDRVRFQAV